ncbi:hypothetical protein D6O16_07125 [Salmonella enterica]|nr:hypothetical protein [Salmonella enterica]EDQ2494198.1 hypothetical protein [Salmonella enterica subsp. enterica serovar Bonariensis]
MSRIDPVIQLDILKILNASAPLPVFRFNISGVSDSLLMVNLNDLILRGLITGHVQHVGYDINKMRPAPFRITDAGIVFLNANSPDH